MNPLNILTPEQYQQAWDEASLAAEDILQRLLRDRLVVGPDKTMTLLTRMGNPEIAYNNAGMIAHHLARFIEAEVQKRLAASEERAEKMRNLKFYSDRLQEQRNKEDA